MNDPRFARRAFTLIELLTVMAIIGILAAILIPTVSSVRVSANKAKTKVQFNQWAAAIESFRSEYGYYPRFDGNLVNAASSGEYLFHDILAGKKSNGNALGSIAAAQHRKRISFSVLGASEFSAENPQMLQDAFGNLALAVIVDRDLDGRITVNDYGTLPVLNGIRPTSGGTESDFPSNGLRARVVFYAPTPDATANDPAFIFSWK